MKNPFKTFDDFFIKLINQDLRHPLLNIFFYYYTNICGPVFLSIFTLIMVIFSKGDLKIASWQMLIGLVLCAAVVFALKRLFNRNRPYWILENLNTYGIDLKDYSFPSGHATAAFTTATIFSLNFPKLSIIFIIMAFLVAISRIYLAVHYPTDVLAGILLGIGTGFLTHYKLYNMCLN